MIIQIVEDDRALSDGIVLALKEPDLEFVQDMTVKSAKDSFNKKCLKLIILDINLPDGSGYDYLKWLRQYSQLPVLVLTANDMEMDEVMGLMLGADDYMIKPFSLAVLRARIKTLMRRINTQNDYVYEEDGFVFDFGTLVFTKNGKLISLSVNEQRLLKLFLENKERIITRNVLIDRLWSDGGEYIDENALSVTVNRLRSKLEDKKDNISYIRTIYGQGYMWKKEKKS